jgi:hypothetical protein
MLKTERLEIRSHAVICRVQFVLWRMKISAKATISLHFFMVKFEIVLFWLRSISLIYFYHEIIPRTQPSGVFTWHSQVSCRLPITRDIWNRTTEPFRHSARGNGSKTQNVHTANWDFYHCSCVITGYRRIWTFSRLPGENIFIYMGTYQVCKIFCKCINHKAKAQKSNNPTINIFCSNRQS